MIDFVDTKERLTGILSHMDEKTLCGEYMVLQACFKAFDDVSGNLECLNPLVVDYMDFLERFISQEICKRFCVVHAGSFVPVGFSDLSDRSVEY